MNRSLIKILSPHDIIQPEIPEERLYWIYSISISWKYRHDNHSSYCKPDDDGFCSNGCCPSPAFRVEPSSDELFELAEKSWSIQVEKASETEGEERHYDLELTKIEIRLRQRSEWWLHWFCSCTFDYGQDNGIVFASFEQYVQWVERNYPQYVKDGCSRIVLMGADDRWRWYGEEEGSSPPCRCDGCKENGVIRINH